MFEAKEIIHQNNDWITLVFLVILILLTLLKVLFNKRLFHAGTIYLSKKYLSIYFNKEKRKILNLFQILLFLVQLLVLTLLFYFANSYFKFRIDLLNFNSYILIFYWVGLYFCLRYAIGFILAYLFNLKNIHTKIVYEKMCYLNNLILWLLPFLVISAYLNNYKKLILESTFILFSVLLILRYSLTLVNNKNLIFSNLFYFILYICALEIAPLIIILKLTF